MKGEKTVPDIASVSYFPQSPAWAQPPPHLWSLMEIKNGVQVAKHDLSCRPGRNIIVLGRDENADIVMQHASISRFHARIAFDKEQGTPWLRDLSSTHGVFVNKRRLPRNSIGREESMSSVAGSRGVIIYPGDIIQLGASTRYFCVDGPSEFERSSMAKRIIPQEKVKDSEDTSTSFSDPTDNDGEYHEEHHLSDETVPESFRVEWERIKALQQKLENIQTESERIHMKGDAGSDSLSAGQLKQLERNEERVATLEEQILTKEAELYRKIFPNDSEVRKRKREIGNDDVEEDDDDYLDRTKDAHSGYLTLNQDGETEQSLLLKWEDLQTQHTEISRKLHSLEQKVSRLEQSIRNLEEEEDLFFIRNELDVLLDTRTKFEKQEKGLVQNLSEIESLIRVVNPKLRKVEGGSTWAMPEQSEMVNASDPVEGKLGALPIQKNGTEDGKKSEFFMIDKLNQPEKQLGSSSQPPEAPSQQKMLPPPPKIQKANSNSAPKGGTLAFLSPSSVPSTKSESLHLSSIQTLRPSDVAEVALNNEQKQDVWQVPKDQDGSGRTKLNAKFAGRY